MPFWLFPTKMVSRDQCLANQNVLQTKCSQPKWYHVISVLQTAEPQKCCHVTRISEPQTKSDGLWGRPKKSTCPRTSEIGSKCYSNKGPDAMAWQNLFGPSKILDKFCLCQIFKLSSVGALRHSKIFVYHKCQSHGNKHHRLHAVRKEGYMRSQES